MTYSYLQNEVDQLKGRIENTEVARQIAHQLKKQIEEGKEIVEVLIK